MWPATSSKLLTSVTVTAAKSYVLLQADPCTWEEEAKCRGIHTAPRVPFAQVMLPLPCIAALPSCSVVLVALVAYQVTYVLGADCTTLSAQPLL